MKRVASLRLLDIETESLKELLYSPDSDWVTEEL